MKNHSIIADILPSLPERQILLHVCCAPCCGYIIEQLLTAGCQLTVLFYNPNIYPEAECSRRKEEVTRFARKKSIPCVDLDYDPEAWRQMIRGLENEPERGKRCAQCFLLRLAKTADYAARHNFKVFATSLGISRWKDLTQVNTAGQQAATRHPGLTFADVNWRANDGFNKSIALARRENFYRQNYCGCEFSRR